jgi:hypothetical protein
MVSVSMRKPASPKAHPGERAKPSRVELAILLALCPLAGIGTGLALENDAIGVAAAVFGLVAVAAYGAAANLDHRPRDRQEASRRISVTEIAERRRGAPGPVEHGPMEQGRAPPPEADNVADVAGAAASERVVPFRIQSVR